MNLLFFLFTSGLGFVGFFLHLLCSHNFKVAIIRAIFFNNLILPQAN